MTGGAAAGGAFVALLRGVNVGRAKRVPMADLRALAESLGHSSVRTLLNSGNLVFVAKRGAAPAIAKALEAALAQRFGFPVPVVVVPLAGLRAAVKEHARAATGRDPARLLVSFVPGPADLAGAKPLLAKRWAPDELRLGRTTALLWCAGGLHDSALWKTFDRATGGVSTARNWTTVLKLVESAGAAGADG